MPCAPCGEGRRFDRQHVLALGLVGIPGAAACGEQAIRNHSKSVALYAAQQGLVIRCNSIHPAAILTDIWEPMLGDGRTATRRWPRWWPTR